MAKISEFILELIDKMGIYGPVLSCALIFIESILPFMPLAVFITVNFVAFGNTLGFIISWFFTVLGCIMSFLIFRKGVQGVFNKLTKDKHKLNLFMDKFNNISLGELVIIIAIPFTPAFLVNIAAGLSKMNFKKFLTALLIGKIGLVYFWGFIGTNLIESFEKPFILIKITLIILIAYLISKIVNHKLKL